MVNNLVFRWPKPLFFMVLGAHGIYTWPNYKHFTDLDFPEIRGPISRNQNATFWGPRSCEVAID